MIIFIVEWNIPTGVLEIDLSLATLVKTVNVNWITRPSVVYTIATDWVAGGCLKGCLMYSRKKKLYLISFLLVQIKMQYFISTIFKKKKKKKPIKMILKCVSGSE